MSYLCRTGNNRNDISFTDSVDQITKYLNRTIMSQLNAIRWFSYDGMSDYANVLERNGAGRNDLIWNYIQLIDMQKLNLYNFLSTIFLYNDRITFAGNSMTSCYRYTFFAEEDGDHYTLGGANIGSWQGDNTGNINAIVYLKDTYKTESEFNTVYNAINKYADNSVLCSRLDLGGNIYNNIALYSLSYSSGSYIKINLKFFPFGIYKLGGKVNVDMYW